MWVVYPIITMNIKVTSNSDNAFSLFIDEEECGFNSLASRKLTETTSESGDGIFDESTCRFFITHTDGVTISKTVNFGSPWSFNYEDPAQEIARRAQLVKDAFNGKGQPLKEWTAEI